MPMAFGNGKGSGAAGMGGYKGEPVTRFAGEKLSVKMEGGGPSIDYDFIDGRKLKWKYAGHRNWREAWYEMYEPDDELYFFAHLLDAEFPRSCAMVAMDMKNGLATLVKGTTGTPFRNNETHPDVLLRHLHRPGRAAGADLPAPRPHRRAGRRVRDLELPAGQSRA